MHVISESNLPYDNLINIPYNRLDGGFKKHRLAYLAGLFKNRFAVSNLKQQT
jgi:hypothetical protein